MRAETQKMMDDLGVTLVSHQDSWLSWIINWLQAKFNNVDNWSRMVWMTIDPHIYAPSRDIPMQDAHWCDSLIRHELAHIVQQRRLGKYKWILKYLLFADFRCNAEINAYMVQFQDGLMDIDMIIEVLSTMYRVGLTRTQLRARIVMVATERGIV
jgi:hypothetical protein